MRDAQEKRTGALRAVDDDLADVADGKVGRRLDVVPLLAGVRVDARERGERGDQSEGREEGKRVRMHAADDWRQRGAGPSTQERTPSCPSFPSFPWKGACSCRPACMHTPCECEVRFPRSEAGQVVGDRTGHRGMARSGIQGQPRGGGPLVCVCASLSAGWMGKRGGMRARCMGRAPSSHPPSWRLMDTRRHRGASTAPIRHARFRSTASSARPSACGCAMALGPEQAASEQGREEEEEEGAYRHLRRLSRAESDT